MRLIGIPGKTGDVHELFTWFWHLKTRSTTRTPPHSAKSYAY